jgi:uncharacterized protein YjbI with pentapeptide repeats
LNNKALLIVFILILAALLLLAFSLPHWDDFPDWTGFQNKKAWDLLELLIVPIVLAIGATLFSQFQRNTEIQIETERQREAALQSYIDRIKDLVLELYSSDIEPDEKSNETPEVFETIGNIAAAYTRATLQQLDSKRKGMLIEFLYDTHLIGWAEPVPDVEYAPLILLGESADLSGLTVNAPALRGIVLSFTNISNSKLLGLDLYKAHLRGSNMSNSYFVGVNFSGAEMGGVNFSGVRIGDGVAMEKTELHYANVKNADLRKAYLNNTNLEGTKYNGKTKFPKGFDPMKAKMVFEK